MTDQLYPPVTRDLARRRRQLDPAAATAFRDFGQVVFAEGALSARTKHLVAVAVAHVTQCPYCIRGHTRMALREGSSEEEVMEAIWVAAEMRAGAAFAHSLIAIDEMHSAGAPQVNGESLGSGEHHAH